MANEGGQLYAYFYSCVGVWATAGAVGGWLDDRAFRGTLLLSLIRCLHGEWVDRQCIEYSTRLETACFEPCLLNHHVFPRLQSLRPRFVIQIRSVDSKDATNKK